MQSFTEWLDMQYRFAASAMLGSISAVDLVQSRPGFGRTVRPSKGSVLASPVRAAYDPDPDYFFHWYRDSAVVIDALRLLYRDGSIGAEALTHVGDFVRFSLALGNLDGRELVAQPAWRAKVAENFTQFVRADADLASVHGEAVAAETRVGPDGTIDISGWPRPQYDGPAMRAIALLRWLRSVPADAEFASAASALLRADLAFTYRHAHRPCFDIWEEEQGLHYYTLCVAATALEEGAGWLEGAGYGQDGPLYRAQAQGLRHTLDGFWLPDQGHYSSRILESGARSTKELDISVVLAAIHTENGHTENGHAGRGNIHSARDSRMHATLSKLEALFDAAYPINRNRNSCRAPAMGRYAGDVYYSGGAYYFSTLGAAEFCFCAAVGRPDARAWLERGDAFLETVRAFTPPSGEMSEQFDQRTGVQTSAKHLAWSYASFISCVAARRSALGRL